MICSDAKGMLAACADGELDAAQERELKSHLAVCTSCTAEHAAIVALGRDIRAQVPRFPAPIALRGRILARLATQGEDAVAYADAHEAIAAPQDAAAVEAKPARHGGEPWWPQRRRWLAAGALAGAVGTVGVGTLINAALDWRTGEDIASEAVASHVRATLGNHLVEVVSSDQHTVKPWLSARLDYSPPVEDLQGEGFALAGARIDYLDRSPVATLVYRYRNHVVDVFVRPRTSREPASGLRTVRGFNVALATGAGMEWRAVADIQADVLVAFVARLSREDAAPRKTER